MSGKQIFVSRGSLSATLSTRLGAAQDLDSFSRGLTTTYLPKSPAEYWTYRRYMHDVLCLALLEDGVYKDEELMLSKLNIKTNNKKLNQQKPDLYTEEIGNLEVGEVLLSYNVESDLKEKNTKYTELFQLISEHRSIQINYNVFAVDLTNPEWEDSLPRLPELHMSMLRNFISNLRFIHANSSFSSYRTDTSEYYALDKFRFELSQEDVHSTVKSISGTGVSLEEFYNRIEGPEPDGLTDPEYISLIADGILKGPIYKRPSPHPEPILSSEFQESWDNYCSSKKNTDKLPRILQLGAPLDMIETSLTFSELISTIRSTNHHGGYLDMVKSFLSASDPDEGHMIKLGLSDAQLLKEQMEGPGRKSALKRQGITSKRDPPKHISICTSHESALEGLIQQIEGTTISCNLNELDMPDLTTVGSSMYTTLDQVLDVHTSSSFSGIAKFYQRFSQEIIINSMRRRKNRQYVICDTGFKGIFGLIAPGPQLRTESNVEFVKIVSEVRPVYNDLSAPWHIVGDHWESDWLSVDTDRLKHWARAFDRTLLSSVACSERLVERGLNLVESCKVEVKNGNYQLLTLTYLEDKQLTSLTNQTIRYLWMKALGDKQFKGIMSKFPSRVGSVIQSTMLQRSYRAIKMLNSRNLSEFIQVSRAKQDEQTGAYDETTTGVVGKLPRLITTGDMVPISYNLNEIYWCMMYNKDRQNPAQDALSILNKILGEEAKFDSEIGKRTEPKAKLDYVFGNTSLQQDLEHIYSKKPESHFFSKRAVRVGISLQSKHEDNVAPDYTWRSHSRINTILNKNLSEFATFKASVKSICSHIDVDDLNELNKIGSRTKAVELVSELVSNEKLTTAFEVAMSFSGQGNKDFEVLIQIFKKGQIGGVREIIILFIKARIIFNIVEEVCRLLAKSDKREILTKGKDKRLMMRGDFEEVLSHFEKGAPVQMIKNSYDMTTWAQKFIPMIFCSIFPKMFQDMPSMKNLCYFIFLKHTNKKIEYPRKLVEMWIKHKDISHEQPWLQKAKDEFLKEGPKKGVPFFYNHSNMCQGIPHYASTCLALSCQSLRDELFKECLKQLGQEARIQWKTRVGSDDKGDMIGIDMSYKEAYSQYLLFEQCAHASERLHSMELSVKSASGNVLYELNSAFMANLETLSPTIKFSMAACDMVSTSSCSVFVNESYGRVRQLRENGGSSALCGLAHLLNRDHFSTIFRTGFGMTNDVTKIFNLPRNKIPYDFGVYPFYDVDIQDIVGPEFHNYVCLTDQDCPLEVKQLLFTPLSKEDLDDAFPSEEEGLLKKDHFGIRQGLIKQLVGMRRRLGVESKDVDDFFRENPFLIIRGPETTEETIKVIHSKLLTKGASEALRRTSPAIYMGRLAAFESAKAWSMMQPTGLMAVDVDQGTMVELEEGVKATYKEFLEWGLSRARKTNFPVDSLINVIFPQKNSYEIIRQFVGQFGPRKENKKRYSQAVRTWVVNNYNYNYSNSLKSILETSFGLSQLSSKEDVNEFRKMLGFNLSSYEGFLEECKARHIRPMDLFFYMSKIYKASKQSKIQTFANGPSTNSLHNTLISIKRFSHLPNHEMVIDAGIDEMSIDQENRPEYAVESLKFCCNLMLMEEQGVLTGPVSVMDSYLIGNSTLREWCETTIRTVRSISGYDHQTKKVMLFLAASILQKDELKEKLLSWKSLNYTYLRRQRKQYGPTGQVTWEGDLELLVNYGPNTFTLNCVNDNYQIVANRIEDHTLLLQALNELCRILGFETRSFFTRRALRPGSMYLSSSGKTILVSTSKGPTMNCLNITLSTRFKHLRLQDLDDFRVVVSSDSKVGSVFVNLEQRGERTATICHFPGTYYQASCPSRFKTSQDHWFRGIRFSTLLKNPDWFYNYRLPSMTDSQCTPFFRNDVNFETVLSQTTYDKGKVVEYLQVMDEINEEAFSITEKTIPMAGTAIATMDYNFDPTMNVNDLFRDEMLKIQSEGVFTNPEPEQAGMSWDDMVAEEEEMQAAREADGSQGSGTDDFFKAIGGKEDGIRFVRSMGYKRKARKANMQVISQMQQGHMIKERVLNMFFKNGSVTSENRRHLPHYYIWLNNHKSEMNINLAQELMRVVVNELRIAMGATEREIMRILSQASYRLEIPPTRVLNFVYNNEEDLYTQMSHTMLSPESDYEESIGDE